MKTLMPLLFAMTAAAQTAPQTVITTHEVSRFLVPVAGTVRGGGGLEYRTDLTVVNFDNTSQLVRFEWIPQTGGSPSDVILTVGNLGFTTFEDIVGTRLLREGVGAILVTAINDDLNDDNAARLDGHARIRASAQGSPATLSLGVPPMALQNWRNGSPAYVHGVRSGDRYRVNVGIVNFDRVRESSFHVLVRSALGRATREVTLAPFTMTQLSFPDAPFGDLSVYIEPRPGAGDWRAYATATDNMSQSGWYVPATQPSTDLVFPTQE